MENFKVDDTLIEEAFEEEDYDLSSIDIRGFTLHLSKGQLFISNKSLYSKFDLSNFIETNDGKDNMLSLSDDEGKNYYVPISSDSCTMLKELVHSLIDISKDIVLINRPELEYL